MPGLMVHGFRADKVVEDHGAAYDRRVRLKFPVLDSPKSASAREAWVMGAINRQHAYDHSHFLNGMALRQRSSCLQLGGTRPLGQAWAAQYCKRPDCLD